MSPSRPPRPRVPSQTRRRLLATVAAGALVAAGFTAAVPAAPAGAAGGPNLAAGRPISASSHTDVYVATNANDGDQSSYWESANHAFPQWLQVDLGGPVSVDQLVLKLPPSGWDARTQTLAVLGSTSGSTFTTILPSGQYLFDPATGNTVTIDFDPTETRFVRVEVTANSGWPAGQVSELEVYGTGGGGGDPGDPGEGSNLAVGDPITASSTVHTFVAGNANDNDVTSYWEGAPGAYPSTLTVALGADAVVSQLVLKLNPDPIWGPRTQTLQVLGRGQGGGPFSTLVPSAGYAFHPATGNTVTIPVSATVADVRLQFTANTGAPNGQVAELQVIGVPAPNPDLVVEQLSWSPAAPVETDQLTLSATLANLGDRPAGATTVDLSLAGSLVDTVPVPGLAAGARATVTAAAGTREAGSYPLHAEVDPAGAVIEQDEANNLHTHPEPLVVAAVASSDLVAAAVTWTPGNPSAGDQVSFSVAIRNQGTVGTAGGAHGITLTVTNDATGQVVRSLSGSHFGDLPPGSTGSPVPLGAWTAADGSYTVTVELAADANELPVKQANNTRTEPLFVGRGANLPYDMYEAEDGVRGGGAQLVGPNRTIGDPAGEASGRRAVLLNTTGSFVEFTTQASTNTLVTRFSIPDAPGGGGITATLNIYVDGQFLTPITLTSRYAWLYGNETNPNNFPGSGPPRHIYDEANLRLGTTVPAGSTIRLQKDPANTTTYAIDFINLEQATPQPNPDPARYLEPDGFTHQDVQAALDRFRMDTSGQLAGVYLPPGDYQTAQKFQVFGRPVEVRGAGPWFTRFFAPQGQDNTDVGFRADPSANGSSFAGFAYFGNYTTRIDGPGKVFDFHNVSDITIDDIWAEHMIVLYWGTNTDRMTIQNSRARNLFADALNMTNGSTDNLVRNIESRASGDDSFALFAATDAGGGAQTGNVYENLTSILTWRAAGVAVYGGFGNTFRNIYIADTLVYAGVTISSLDFGIPMDGFGADPPTRFEDISIVRAGGHFFGAQTFPAIWVFSASKTFQGIRVSDVDIVDPTYSGIMFQTNYVGGQPQNPVTDTVFTNVTITGAQLSGDEFEAKSGFGIWVNELPEPGQGPAVGSARFVNLQLSNNHQDVRNTTSTFQLIFE